MAKDKLYDNLIKVIKGNSGPFTANDGVLTEIFDLQIPRGYCARIREVRFTDLLNLDQLDQTALQFFGALVLDADDETSYQIPTFTVDHDVLCDFQHEYVRFEEDTTPNGISVVHNRETHYKFEEDLDVVTVRNIRFNSSMHGGKGDGTTKPQVKCIVFFTYEKVSADLYSKLLGIS